MLLLNWWPFEFYYKTAKTQDQGMGRLNNRSWVNQWPIYNAVWGFQPKVVTANEKQDYKLCQPYDKSSFIWACVLKLVKCIDQTLISWCWCKSLKLFCHISLMVRLIILRIEKQSILLLGDVIWQHKRFRI